MTPHDTGLAVHAPELDDIITDADLDNYRGDRRLLREAIPVAVRAGHSGNKIAARLAGVFGQQAVINYVAALRTADRVGKALAKAGLKGPVVVGASGPDSPVGAWMQLSITPDQLDAERFAAIPERVRTALAPALLTIDPACDPLFLDGGRVYVRKIQPKV